MVELHVQDDGPGVRDIDAPRLYDWFFSGPKPRDSIVAGTGMGLAIAQEYAQQHEGDIRLLPSEKGAHFRLTLPSVGQDNE
jgi:two-component system sensor histidine kinase GlrK